MNIFKSLGRAASKAARAIKPKRLHGPRHGAKEFLKKHAKLAAILTAGVGLGAGADGLIELAKGKPEEEAPIIMLGGELSEHKTTDDSWNFLHFDIENDNFSEEKTILDIQNTDPNSTADHNDALDFGRAHASHHENHHGEFLTKVKAALLFITVIIIILCLLKLRKTVRKWMKMCFKKKKDKVDLPRLDIIQDEWQSHKGPPTGNPPSRNFLHQRFLRHHQLPSLQPNDGHCPQHRDSILQ